MTPDRDATDSPSQEAGSNVRHEDSWIDVAAASASSFAASSAEDRIITAGLSVRRSQENVPTRSPLDHLTHLRAAAPQSVAGSSQDEYEESESESDLVLSSSNDDMSTTGGDDHDHNSGGGGHSSSRSRSDADGVATLVIQGRSQPSIFTPQPNAFSHPPQSAQTQSSHATNSYFPRFQMSSVSDQPPPGRRTSTIQTRRRRPSPGTMRHQPDHDAALRASLTTLLSCAAAVRPKRMEEPAAMARRSPPATTTTALRIVSEAELSPRPLPTQKNPSKRSPRESSKERQRKKMRAVNTPQVEEELISPSVMAWLISAGVVIVFSALSFSAGYAWGKEVGQVEAQMSCNSCSTQAAARAGSGLRKLRWTSAAQSVRA